MATQPTNLPVPSESARDLKFNAGKIDEFVTSPEQKYIDRFGDEHYTIEGINNLAQQVMNSFGYITLTDVSFTIGATITKPNEVLFNEANGEYYKWTGSFASGPKVVPPNSTPESTGGIGAGAWLSVGDSTALSVLNEFKEDLASPDNGKGDALIGVKQPYDNTASRTQHDKNAETLSILDFYIPNQQDWTQAFKNASIASQYLGKQVFVPEGTYEVSDSIILYDDNASDPVLSFYKGNGSKFFGEGMKTVIYKTSIGTLPVNCVFTCEPTTTKRGLALRDMAIIDLTDGSRCVYMQPSLVCSEFKNLFCMGREIGFHINSAFVNVNIEGIVCQAHTDELNYPMKYGMRIGSSIGTSVTIDKCHVGHVTQDAYNFFGNYSKIGVLSSDNIQGVNYVFDGFKGSVDIIAAEWGVNTTPQNSTFAKFTNSLITIDHISMLNKVVVSGGFLFSSDSSQVKINHVNTTDNCIFSGSVARLRNSSQIDIGYFTQYKYEQFVDAINYDANTNTFMSVGNLAATQYRGYKDISINGTFTLPSNQPSGECYRIMGTKNTAAQSGCVGTLTSIRGRTVNRSSLIMDVVCNGNGIIGTSAIAIKKAVSDPVGLTSYTGWYEGNVGGTLYMLLKMDAVGDRNLGTFFSGVTIGRDPNLFRIVGPSDISGLVSSTIGVMKTEQAI
ncbi:hypothetical protein [Hafnia alvei]|uniref:tail fiber/spike domain-containing protein n=1 Tax=Hafnia alvei TaxID=569 RepID=UPI00187D14B6|nr:hypothetical protein [Hafnia alvei]